VALLLVGEGDINRRGRSSMEETSSSPPSYNIVVARPRRSDARGFFFVAGGVDRRDDEHDDDRQKGEEKHDDILGSDIIIVIIIIIINDIILYGGKDSPVRGLSPSHALKDALIHPRLESALQLMLVDGAVVASDGGVSPPSIAAMESAARKKTISLSFYFHLFSPDDSNNNHVRVRMG
jgi:hypothetical protein